MRQSKLSIWGLLFLFSIAIQSTAWGQYRIGDFEITGYYQFTVNPNTDSTNPNNTTCLTGPCSPGLYNRGGKPNFHLMRQFLDVNIFGKLNENWSVNLSPRFILDMTKYVDTHYRQYDSFAKSFAGNGNLLEVGGNDFGASLNQAYVDYKKGNVWLRMGKQQIAWGEALGLRVLDTVEPLDLRQFFFFDRIFEEFDKIRIPQWFFRGDYTIPNETVPDLTAEFILNPGAVVPTLLPAQGAPYNVVPAFLNIRNNVPQGEPTVGGRLTGTASDVQFSFNFITKPNDDAVGVFQSFVGGCFAPPFNPLACKINLDGRHPRVYIVGGSANYNWTWAGAILRAETTVTPNAPFLNVVGGTPLNIVKRPQWKTVLAVDRPTYVIPGLDSMTIGFQYFPIYTGGNLDGLTDANGSKVDTVVNTVTFFFQQPVLEKRLSLEFFALYDTDNAYWLQPGAHWEIGNNVRLDLYYNQFGGSEKRAGRFGAFAFANGPFFRFTYGF
jgi:hypothetical protein